MLCARDADGRDSLLRGIYNNLDVTQEDEMCPSIQISNVRYAKSVNMGYKMNRRYLVILLFFINELKINFFVKLKGP